MRPKTKLIATVCGKMSGPQKNKGVSPALYLRQYVSFLRPVRDLMFNSGSNHTGQYLDWQQPATLVKICSHFQVIRR